MVLNTSSIGGWTMKNKKPTRRSGLFVLKLERAAGIELRLFFQENQRSGVPKHCPETALSADMDIKVSPDVDGIVHRNRGA
jgi:hypothetical protein